MSAEQGQEVRRSERIGSGDAPVILQEDPWSTPYQRWLEKTGRVPRRAQTPAMTRGLRLEEQVRAMYEERVGKKFAPVMLTHPELPWLVAQIDGCDPVMGLDGVENSLIEIKCPGRPTHEKAAQGEVVRHYWIQCQHQMLVAAAPRTTYISYHPDMIPELVVLPVERDQAFLENVLLPAEIAFYRCIVDDKAPALSPKDERVRLDPEWQALAEEYRKAESVVAEWESKRKAAREALIAMADGVPRVRGGGLLLSLNEVKGRVNYDKVPELRGVDLDPYRGPTRMEHRLTVERPKGA